MKTTITILITLFLSVSLNAQVPFHRGVNLTGWFQADNIRQVQFTKYTKQDLINIKSLGCDVIRLPINLNFMTSGSPDYEIDPLFYSFMDQVLDWAEELQIYVILDNHTFDPNQNTDPNIGQILDKVWLQMAEHYQNRSAYILYEVLNEPHGISAASWGTIQQNVITTIRSVDTKHTIIVGGVNYNGYNDLSTIPAYSDTNLIYTFHFYDPFIFTHQGASWTDPSMEPLSGVPFPYVDSMMPDCPASLKGTWLENSINNYINDGTEAKVKSLLNIAINFKKNKAVNVFCGEFGVYNINSNNSDRINWYWLVRTYLEENGIPWTTWDYQGGFGLFKKGSNELFDYDLNTELLQKLGLNVPSQKVFNIVPDSTGFPVYSDYMEHGMQNTSSNSATLDFYNDEQPNNGKYCLYWTGASQYNYIGFEFNPERDFSYLETNHYALDFMVRGIDPETNFVLRFIDTKTGDTDHPWRMDYTINSTKVSFDRKWHHLHIPLNAFTDAGSWDNNQWYTSQNEFDWKAVATFNIVAENMPLTDKDLWFDNIHITELDTAQVYNHVTLGIKTGQSKDNLSLQAYPNPAGNPTTFTYLLKKSGFVTLTIYSLLGQRIETLVNREQPAGKHSVSWYLKDSNQPLANGIYICNLLVDDLSQNIKIVIN